MTTLQMKNTISQYGEDIKNNMISGMCLVALTGIGLLFLAAVPIVVMFGGFSNKSTSMWDSLASVGYTFIVGIILYAVLISMLVVNYY